MARKETKVEPTWLTADELHTWKTLHYVVATLPSFLGERLRCDADLSFIEYYVLAALSEQPGHAMRMSQLAVLAGSELSRLSHLTNRLAKRGLVRRETDPTDGRFTNAVLTDAGYALVVETAPGHVEQVRQLIFSTLTKTEQHALRSALDKIAAGIAIC
jgi:DNA-binding MarR family transcriptional regulator